MGTLYVVATPIGNLEDVTLRALRILAECDPVLAEDTRRTRILLSHHGIEARLVSLHAHNEAARRGEVIAALDADGSVALVSDAGTPLVSDPGQRICEAAIAADHAVVPIPGPSAPLAALVASGLPAERFTFIGFLPRQAGKRRALLAELAGRPETLLLFESPRRLAATLRELSEVCGPRRACVARELTKLHEEAVRATLPELAERFADGTRGEVTLVVEGAAPAAALAGDALDARIQALLEQDESPREIAAALAPLAAVAKREVYARALALRKAEPPAGAGP